MWADEVCFTPRPALSISMQLLSPTTSPTLAASFTREIEAVIELICEAPERWRFFEQDVRRGLARRFPYAVLYTIEDKDVLIVAVMHCRREPGYWKQRATTI